MSHIRLKLKQNKLSTTWDIMSLNNFKKLAKPSKIGICELVFFHRDSPYKNIG